MTSLLVIPIQKELDFFVQGCAKLGFSTEASLAGRLPVVQVPDLNITVARGGLGKDFDSLETSYGKIQGG